MKVKCELVVWKPEKELIPLKAHMNHQHNTRSVLSLHTPFPTQWGKPFVQSYWCKARSYAFARTKQVWHHRHMAWCPVLPDPRSFSDAKKKTPRALICSESAERGWCPADYVREAEQTWKRGVGGEEKQELSYGLGNFNDTVCKKVFKR